VLTTFGLTIALVGILVLYIGLAPEGGTLATLDWREIARGAGSLSDDGALLAFLLIVGGLATKIGWAPVHNWLPDAHSEAPPPVSALLSAALLPTVILIAWRVLQTLGPALRDGVASAIFLAFGLASLAIAVPFLWRPLALKRLLAYSSLEHMGLIALGIGFATPLALAGTAVHIAAHAVAKALGFYAATPLLGHEPSAGENAVTGIGRSRPMLGLTMGLSLGALSGLPPSPLFVSEVLIVAGGFQAGRPWAAAATALLLALGFLGLAHALLETAAGEPRRRDGLAPGLRGVTALAGVSAVLLLALAAAGVWLPGTELVDALIEGAS
jgi:hydrogenase-4 component F